MLMPLGALLGLRTTRNNASREVVPALPGQLGLRPPAHPVSAARGARSGEMFAAPACTDLGRPSVSENDETVLNASLELRTRPP